MIKLRTPVQGDCLGLSLPSLIKRVPKSKEPFQARLRERGNCQGVVLKMEKVGTSQGVCVAFRSWEMGRKLPRVSKKQHRTANTLSQPSEIYIRFLTYRSIKQHGGSDGKASACNVGDLSSIPGSGRSPGKGNGNPLEYSCLEDPTRLLYPWKFPGKNTGVRCHALLQVIFWIQGSIPISCSSCIAGSFFTREPLGKLQKDIYVQCFGIPRKKSNNALIYHFGPIWNLQTCKKVSLPRGVNFQHNSVFTEHRALQ